MSQSNIEKIYETLQSFKRKRITLNELSSICSDTDSLSEQITALVQHGVLVPVRSSGTNGNHKTPMSFIRYCPQAAIFFAIVHSLSITESFCAV